MAQIDIERKKGAAWIWVLILALAFVGAWILAVTRPSWMHAAPPVQSSLVSPMAAQSVPA